MSRQRSGFLRTLISSVLTSALLIVPAVAAPVTVRVLSADKKPVPGVQVTTASSLNFASFGAEKEISKTTNSSGVAIFGEFKSEGAVVNVRYALAIGADNSLAATVLHEGRNDLTLLPSTKVSGKVLGGGGAPVAGARVSLMLVGISQSDNVYSRFFVPLPPTIQNHYSAVSNAEGSWSIPGIPTGSMAIFHLMDDRFANTTVVYGNEMTFGMGDISSSNLILNAVPGSAVTGRVLNEKGRPLSKINVFGDSRTEGFFNTSDGITDANGRFFIKRLAPSKAANLRVSIPRGVELIAPAIPNFAIKAGRTTTLPDIRLISGALIQGKVTDSSTGKGLSKANISVSAKINGQYIGSSFVLSGADGTYRLRVLPGQYAIAIRCENYGRLATTSKPERLILSVTAATPTVQDFPLRPLPPINGIAVDLLGKPIPNARFRFGINYMPQQIVADKNGRWKAKGIDETNAYLSEDGEWTVVRPNRVKLPAKGPLKIVLQRVVNESLMGRVTSPDGKPLAGAVISVGATGSAMERLSRNTPIITGPDGTYKFTKLRMGQRPYRVTARLDNYLTVSSPAYQVFTRVGNGWEAKPIVMARLAAPVSGKVVDEDGMPVPGATVTASRGMARLVQVDKVGSFVIDNLQEGNCTLTAFAKDLSASVEIQVSSSTSPVEIVLHSTRSLAYRDVDRAYAIVSELLAKSNGAQFWGRREAVRILDNYDQDLAEKLHVYPASKVTNRWELAIELDRVMSDPEGSLPRAKELLERVDATERKPLSAFFSAARGLQAVSTDRSAALEMLKTSEKQLREMTNDERTNARDSTIMACGLTGALATKLGKRSAITWRDLAMTIVELPTPEGFKSGDESKAQLLSLAMRGGPASYALYEDEIPAPIRMQALAQSIQRIAPSRIDDAMQLLQKLQSLAKTVKPNKANQPNLSQGLINQAMLSVIGPLTVKNPQRALELARRLTRKDQQNLALCFAASGQEPKTRTRLFSEAFESAKSQGLGRKSLVASMAYDCDPALGATLFDKIEKDLELQQKRGMQDVYAVKEVAFYLARYDRLKAREILERSLDRERKRNLQGMRFSMFSTVVAMSAVDMDRAVELSRSMENPDEKSLAQITLAYYALSDAKQRRAAKYSDIASYNWRLQ